MSADHSAFLGTWRLVPDSCRYEQGTPPREGAYRIRALDDGQLEFTASWVDADGKDHSVTFSGHPDGRRSPLGGDPVDALSVHAVSPRELNSSGWIGEREVMIAQRQLDDTGQAMRVIQVVRLPDGTAPANVAIYVRQPQPLTHTT